MWYTFIHYIYKSYHYSKVDREYSIETKVILVHCMLSHHPHLLLPPSQVYLINSLNLRHCCIMEGCSIVY